MLELNGFNQFVSIRIKTTDSDVTSVLCKESVACVFPPVNIELSSEALAVVIILNQNYSHRCQ